MARLRETRTTRASICPATVVPPESVVEISDSPAKTHGELDLRPQQSTTTRTDAKKPAATLSIMCSPRSSLILRLFPKPQTISASVLRWGRTANQWRLWGKGPKNITECRCGWGVETSVNNFYVHHDRSLARRLPLTSWPATRSELGREPRSSAMQITQRTSIIRMCTLQQQL